MRETLLELLWCCVDGFFWALGIFLLEFLLTVPGRAIRSLRRVVWEADPDDAEEDEEDEEGDS